MNVVAFLDQWKWGPWLRSLFAPAISAAMIPFTINPAASVIGAPNFSPRQLMMVAAWTGVFALASAWQKSPFPDRKVQIALLPGVHNIEQVEQIAKVTSGGTIPTPAEAQSIIAEMPPTPTTGGNL